MINTKRTFVCIVVIVLVFLTFTGAGCNWKFWDKTGTDKTNKVKNEISSNKLPNAGNTTNTASGDTADKTAKDFSNFPLKIGTSWKYKGTSDFFDPVQAPSTQFEQDSSIEAISGNEYTINSYSSSDTYATNAKTRYGFDAKKENLYINYLESDALIPGSPQSFGVVKNNYRGFKIASTADDTWNLSASVEQKVTVSGEEITASYRLEGTGKVINPASQVSVPAGDFTAIEVELDYTLALENYSIPEIEKLEIASRTINKEKYWIDPSVGVIKYSNDVTTQETTLNSVMQSIEVELVEYNL